MICFFSAEWFLPVQRQFHSSGAGIWAVRGGFLCRRTAFTRRWLREGHAAPLGRFCECLRKARLDNPNGLRCCCCCSCSSVKKVSPFSAHPPWTQRSSPSARSVLRRKLPPGDASQQCTKWTIPSNEKLLRGKRYPTTAPQRCLVRVLNLVSYRNSVFLPWGRKDNLHRVNFAHVSGLFLDVYFFIQSLVFVNMWEMRL